MLVAVELVINHASGEPPSFIVPPGHELTVYPMTERPGNTTSSVQISGPLIDPRLLALFLEVPLLG